MIEVTTATSTLDELLTVICHQLQITETQQRQAESHYTAIGRLLESPTSPLAPHRPSLYPQGSLRLGTTVRPSGRENFDLDLVCQLATNAIAFPNPSDLIGRIGAFLLNQAD